MKRKKQQDCWCQGPECKNIIDAWKNFCADCFKLLPRDMQAKLIVLGRERKVLEKGQAVIEARKILKEKLDEKNCEER